MDRAVTSPSRLIIFLTSLWEIKDLLFSYIDERIELMPWNKLKIVIEVEEENNISLSDYYYWDLEKEMFSKAVLGIKATQAIKIVAVLQSMNMTEPF